MQEYNIEDIATAETQNIMVSVCRELLDTDTAHNKLWGYYLRIENNSADSITLTGKNLYITDNLGQSRCDISAGFHGEIPNLEPGEYFEFEDMTDIKADTAVLYGFCKAVSKSGTEFHIALPPIQLSDDLDSRPKIYH